jgi:hypothetical protein
MVSSSREIKLCIQARLQPENDLANLPDGLDSSQGLVVLNFHSKMEAFLYAVRHGLQDLCSSIKKIQGESRSSTNDWRQAAVKTGKLFRKVSSAGKAWGEGVTEKLVWHVVRICKANRQ